MKFPTPDFEVSLRRNRRPRRRLLAAMAAGLLAVPAVPALAATIVVDGNCTLVQAIKAANQDGVPFGGCELGGGFDTIELTGDQLLTTIEDTHPAYGPSGLPAVSSRIQINGNGHSITRSPGAPDFRLFVVRSPNATDPGSLDFVDTELRGGRAVDSSTSFGGYGGAVLVINSPAWVRFTRSIVTNNFSSSHGGAVGMASGDIVIFDSEFSDNTSSIGGAIGGVISATSPGMVRSLLIANSTFSGNKAEVGAAIDADVDASEIRASTFTNNSTSGSGFGAIELQQLGGSVGSAVFTQNLMAGNPGSADLRVSIPAGSLGNGVFGTVIGNLQSQPTDMFDVVDPGLLPLALNGSPRRTHALKVGSPALDKGVSFCVALKDQRGIDRPQGAACESGAFESRMFTLTVSLAGSGSGVVTSAPAGIVCGGDCTEDVPEQNVVTLSAAPASGSSFTGWSGACTGTGNCVVTMSQARNVTATFAVVAPPPTCETAQPTHNCTVNGVKNQLCVGTAGNDTLIGSNGPNVIFGLGGNDVLKGGNAQDLLCGGDGNDTLRGGNGRDRLFGGAGNDQLHGENSDDVLDGGSGTDTANGGKGIDTCSAESESACEQ